MTYPRKPSICKSIKDIVGKPGKSIKRKKYFRYSIGTIQLTVFFNITDRSSMGNNVMHANCENVYRVLRKWIRMFLESIAYLIIIEVK